MFQPLSLLIAANHPNIAKSLLRKMKMALGREVEAETLTSLVSLRVRMRIGNLPRLVIVDCALHGFDPAETMAELHLDRPAVRLVAITQHSEPRQEAELVRSGARAVLSWSACPRLTARVLEIVAAGSSYMSTAALMAVSGAGELEVAAGGMPRSIPPLTERENTILAHIKRGDSNRAIGEALGIAENRVKIHLRAIFRKTGARNRTEAALRASEGVPAGDAPLPPFPSLPAEGMRAIA